MLPVTPYSPRTVAYPYPRWLYPASVLWSAVPAIVEYAFTRCVLWWTHNPSIMVERAGWMAGEALGGLVSVALATGLGAVFFRLLHRKPRTRVALLAAYPMSGFLLAILMANAWAFSWYLANPWINLLGALGLGLAHGTPAVLVSSILGAAVEQVIGAALAPAVP